MRLQPAGIRCMEEREIEAIVQQALRILDEIGMIIQSPMVCQRLADAGAKWDGKEQVRFPRSVMENHLTTERRQPPTAPERNEGHIGGSIGCYPLRWVDPFDGQVKLHTAHSVADLTRLADAVPNIEGIGSAGVPSDIPPLLQPLWQRFISWRYAQNKISNTYTILDARLCPYIAEFVETISALEPQQGGVKRFFRAENYVVSPLRYARGEAEQLEWFYERGYRMTVGNLLSIGGSAPVTLAGAISLGLAEMMALSLWHKALYGDRGLYLSTTISPLDMRSGCMPYGRPEQTLVGLAFSQIGQYLGTMDGIGAGHGTTAKGADIECGLDKGLHAGMSLVLSGNVHWHFGIFSIDEVYDPALILIENEYLESLKRIARGFEVNEQTLAYDVIKEVGPGGQFLGHPHTHEHFRDELWLPDLFNGQIYESFASQHGQPILERARKKAREILETHHPRGISQATEEKLRQLLDGYARKLGYEPPRPEMPE